MSKLRRDAGRPRQTAGPAGPMPGLRFGICPGQRCVVEATIDSFQKAFQTVASIGTAPRSHRFIGHFVGRAK